MITVCNPNPCLHGGVCLSLNSTAYRCNCTKTAYTGNKCHLGIFLTPKYPRLHVGFSLNITFTLSPPENDLAITPSGPGVEFHPRSLLISPAGLPKETFYHAKMAITARLPGVHLIKYTLSGVDAKSYQTVLPDAVSVAENDTLCNDTASISFPSGCHKLRLFKCHSGDDFLNAMSTESWKRYKRQVSTEGFITILSSNLTLPLALRGASFDKMSPSSIQTDQKGECKAHTNTKCLPTETLASAFLKSLNASFPIWFRLVPSKTFANFKASDLITYIWKGKQLRGVLQDIELSINEESYYSVLLYTNSITVKVGKSIVKLPKYEAENTHLLIAAELCSQSLYTKVLVAFNPLSYSALDGIPVYQQLAQHGWKVTALALQFSMSTALHYSVYVLDQTETQIYGNLELYGRVGKSVNGSYPVSSVSVRVAGSVITHLPNRNEVRYRMLSQGFA